MIQGKRILLRPLELTDSADLVEGLNNSEKEMLRFIVTERNTSVFDKQDVYSYIFDAKKRFCGADDLYLHLGIFLKENSKLIGAIRLWQTYAYNVANPCVSTETWLSKVYRGKEYGLEAKVLLMDYAFTNLKVETFETIYAKDNKASERMNSIIGFSVWDDEGGDVWAYISKEHFYDKKMNTGIKQFEKYILKPTFQAKEKTR